MYLNIGPEGNQSLKYARDVASICDRKFSVTPNGVVQDGRGGAA